MAVLILMLCLLLSTSTTIAAGNGEQQIRRYSRNVRLSVADITEESATLEWVVPEDEVTQKGFKIKCTGRALETPVYDDSDEYEYEQEDLSDVKVLYASEDESSIDVNDLKPGYEYSCSLNVERTKRKGRKSWRELIEPITFETLNTDSETISATTEPEGKFAAALNFSKNYRKMLVAIVFGGVVPILMLLGCLGVCILYCKCRLARMRDHDKRYALFTRSVLDKKKANEIAELGLSPGMIDHRNPAWMTGQKMFRTYAAQQQPHVQGNARSNKWSARFKHSKRYNTPITSIRLSSDIEIGQKSTNKTLPPLPTYSPPKISSSSPSSDSDRDCVTSVNSLQIPDHIQAPVLSSPAFGIKRMPPNNPTTTLSHSQSINRMPSVSTSQLATPTKPKTINRRIRTRKTPASHPVLTSESSSEVTVPPRRQPLCRGSRSLISMCGFRTKSRTKMPPPKPIVRRENSAQPLTLLDILANIPLPPEQDDGL